MAAIMKDLDLMIYRGSTLGVLWTAYLDTDWQVLFDLTGYTAYLTVYATATGTLLFPTKTSTLGNPNIDPAPNTFTLREATGEVIWKPSIAESRLIPLGKRSKYELELRIGSEQEPLAFGTFEGIGGHNSD